MNCEEQTNQTETQKKEEEKRAAQVKGLRRNLYEHVTLSVRTLDTIIAVCALLIALLLAVGIFRK